MINNLNTTAQMLSFVDNRVSIIDLMKIIII